MKVFLDECLPIPLANLLTGHEVETSKSMGWEAIQNGALLNLVEVEFDIFLTADSNMRHQQDVTNRKVAFIELSTNNLRRIKAAITLVREAIDTGETGKIVRVEIPYPPEP